MRLWSHDACHDRYAVAVKKDEKEAAAANFVWEGSVATECCKWRGVKDPSPEKKLELSSSSLNSTHFSPFKPAYRKF